MATIGEAIDKKIEEAMEMYEAFVKSDDRVIRNRAAELATHDLYQEIHIAERALERVKEYIKAQEAE